MLLRIRCPRSECGKECKIEEAQLGLTLVCMECGRPFSAVVGAEPTAIPGGEVDTSVGSATGSAAAGRDRPIRKLGRFEVRSRLGAGGFGTVYLAYDPVLDREVALKVPRATALAQPQLKARFLREPKAAAQLRHPNIVSIFEAGADGDQYYIASAYIEGHTLASVLDQRRPELRQAAEMVRDLAEALHYAHRMGVVHRDVKPANIMIDGRGQPMLMDFGLARLAGSAEEKLTQDGAVMGTPAYMAPEQADSSLGDVGPASDQYSLGVVLYEMLCAETPFSGPPVVLIYNMLNAAPKSPRARNPRVPRDLETICLKAMSKQPSQRYAGCGEMADDLRRWLADEPIRARPLGLAERAAKWVRRNPLVAALVAGIAIVTLAALAVVTDLWRNAEASRQEASQKAKQAIDNEKDARQQRSEAESARRVADGARKLADDRLLDLEKTNRELDRQREEAQKASEVAQKASEAAIQRQREAEEAKKQAEIARQEARASLKEVENQRQIAVERERIARRHLYASEMNLAMQAAEGNEPDRLLDMLTRQIPKVAKDEDLRSFEWHWLATRWANRDRKTDAKSLKYGAEVYSIFLSPRHNVVVGFGKTDHPRYWNIDNPTISRGAPPLPKYSPLGAYLIRAEAEGSEISGPGWEGRFPFARTPDGEVFALAESKVAPEYKWRPIDHTWHCKGIVDTQMRQIPNSSRPPYPVKIWTSFRSITVKSLGSEAELLSIKDCTEPMALSSDGRLLAATAWTKATEDEFRGQFPEHFRLSIQVWDLATRKMATEIPAAGMMPYFSLVFSPNGRELAVLEPSQPWVARPAAAANRHPKQFPGRIRVIALAKPGFLCELPAYTEHMAFSANGSKVAGLYLGKNPSIAVLDLATGKKCRFDNAIGSAVALSPDGGTLVSWVAHAAGGSPQSTTKLEKSLAAVEGDLNRNSDNEILLRELPSGGPRATLKHKLAIRAVLFTADGKSLLTGSEDGMIRFWDPSNGDEKCAFRAHPGGVLCMALSNDGSILASGGSDGTIQLWLADPKAAANVEQYAPQQDAKLAPANGPDKRQEKGH